ncbi:hypothetical protein AABM38_14680 [Heyndrickxia sp. MSNUG]|uniref:hypothetical protein n=1 Tax=Heyndrickxia sp. MSNUG TaxID=3136677 RepID=UPI003C2E4D84
MKALRTLFILSILLINNGYGIEAKKQSGNQKVQMYQWEEVNDILPKYSKFTVVDLETGMKFRVQRRAGSNHADVQPLTSEDTAIMKKIYNGQWSWKRRAILVISDEQMKIAASMHGMPHGGGALKNNFPGHFCIHFYGSTTHRTNFMDLSHKLMILKAAGRLELYLEQTDPYDLINAFIAGIKQQDPKIVSYISLQEQDWDTILPSIDNVRISRMEVLPHEDITDELSLSVPVEINWQIKGVGGRNFTGLIKLVRFMPNEQWKIDSVQFLKDNGMKATK